MSVANMKADRDAKMEARKEAGGFAAEKAKLTSPLSSPASSPRVVTIAAPALAPPPAAAAPPTRKSGRGRGLGRSMSVSNMKAERDAKMADRAAAGGFAAEKAASQSVPSSPVAARSPNVSPRFSQPSPAAIPAFRPAVGIPAFQPAAVAPKPLLRHPSADVPANWASMSKLEQIKWQKEQRTKAQDNWQSAGAKVAIAQSLKTAVTFGAPTIAPAELPANWGSMTKLEQVKWKRQSKESAAGAQSPTQATAPAAAPRAAGAAVARVSALRVTPPSSPTSASASAVAPSDLRDRLTTASLHQEVQKLAREKECLMLGAAHIFVFAFRNRPTRSWS